MIKKIIFFTFLLAYCATAPIDTPCPAGTVFNSAIHICDWPNNVAQTATQASVIFAPVTQSGEFSNLNFGTTQFAAPTAPTLPIVTFQTTTPSFGSFTVPTVPGVVTVPTQVFTTTTIPFTATVSQSFFNTQTVTTPFQSIEFSNLNNGNSQVNFRNGAEFTTTSPFAFTTVFTPSFTGGNPSEKELVHFLNVLGETTLVTTTAKVQVFNHIPTDISETSKSSGNKVLVSFRLNEPSTFESETSTPGSIPEKSKTSKSSGKLLNKALVSFRLNEPSASEAEAFTPGLEFDTSSETTRRVKTTTTTTTEFVESDDETVTTFETITVKMTPKKKLKSSRVNNLLFEEVSDGRKKEPQIERSSTVSNIVLTVTIPTPSNTKADKKVLINRQNLHLLLQGSSRIATTTPEVLLDETEPLNEEEQIIPKTSTKTIPKKEKKSKHKKKTTTTVSPKVEDSIDDVNEEVTTVSSTTVLTTTEKIVDFTLTELSTESFEELGRVKHTTVITITKDVTSMMKPITTTTSTQVMVFERTTEELLNEEETNTVETTKRRKITTEPSTVVFKTPTTFTESTTTTIATNSAQVMVFETTQSIQTDELAQDEGINTELLNEAETTTRQRKITTKPIVAFTTPRSELGNDKLEVDHEVDTLNEEEITKTTRRLMVAQTTATTFTDSELADIETTTVLAKKGNFRTLTTTPAHVVEDSNDESSIQREEITNKVGGVSNFEFVEVTTTPTTTVKMKTTPSKVRDMSGLDFEEISSTVKPRKVKSDDRTDKSNDE